MTGAQRPTRPPHAAEIPVPWTVPAARLRCAGRALERASSSPARARGMPTPGTCGERSATREHLADVGAPGPRRRMCRMARRRRGGRSESTFPPVASISYRLCAELTRTRVSTQACGGTCAIVAHGRGEDGADAGLCALSTNNADAPGCRGERCRALSSQTGLTEPDVYQNGETIGISHHKLAVVARTRHWLGLQTSAFVGSDLLTLSIPVTACKQDPSGSQTRVILSPHSALGHFW
jgi:hypothetical protein